MVTLAAIALLVTAWSPTPAAASDRFVDVGRDGRHGQDIDRIAAAGITRGCDPPANDRFCPTRTVTRAEMASFLSRALGLPASRARPFTDARGSTHERQIAAIHAAGITHGCNPPANDRFCPDRPVTRAEMASFLVRAFDLPASNADHFFDVSGVHRRDIDAVAAAGITAGCNAYGTEFCPDRALPREQMASFLARATNLSPRQTPPVPFRWELSRLTSQVRSQMTGTSWEPGCPVHLNDLRMIRLNHRGFDGRVHDGLLIAHRNAVADLERVFATMYRTGFPLGGVEPAYRFGGDDDAIMAANVSHAFNCRAVTGGSRWSEHSYGTAIDLNPVQNPYARGGTVLPPSGRSYLNRSNERRGMLLEGDAVVRQFDRLGWTWGGRWNSLVDHMHFERPR